MRCAICGQAEATRTVKGVPACNKSAHDVRSKDRKRLKRLMRTEHSLKDRGKDASKVRAMIDSLLAR